MTLIYLWGPHFTKGPFSIMRDNSSSSTHSTNLKRIAECEVAQEAKRLKSDDAPPKATSPVISTEASAEVASSTDRGPSTEPSSNSPEAPDVSAPTSSVAPFVKLEDSKVKEADLAEIKTKRAIKMLHRMNALRVPTKSPSTFSSLTTNVQDENAPSREIYKPGRRKKRMAKRSPLDLEADESTFIIEGSAADFPTEDQNVLVDWKLKDDEMNVIHRRDSTSMEFTFLKEILHLVDRANLISLYTRVTSHYCNKKPQGSGMFLPGDLQVLLNSHSPNSKAHSIWENSHRWKVASWRFYPLPRVHVLETKSGITVCMLAKRKYPLPKRLMERMLSQKLEIPPYPVGNEKLSASTLVGLIKTQLLQQQHASSSS